MEELRNVYKIWVGKPKRKRPIGRPRNRWEDNAGIYVREVWWDIMCIGRMWLLMGHVTGGCEYSNEASGSIKGGKFLDCLSDYQLLKRGSALWGQLSHFTVT
jgi:hypothetical protein